MRPVKSKSCRRRAKRADPRPPGQEPQNYPLYLGMRGAVVITVCLMCFGHSPPVRTETTRPVPESYHTLLTMAPGQLKEQDIAAVNLLCAQGLPGVDRLDIGSAEAVLRRWADRVRRETARHLYRVSDPRYANHYRHSEARLRAEFLVQVLQEDCGIRYNLERVQHVNFSNPHDLFISGLIGRGQGGTCSSMPVLYTAVGRRLGYPLKLVLAKQHVFCRWEDERERLNIEAAGNGGVSYPHDEHYRSWPIPISDAELLSGEFLKSLSPQEELAVFLLQRAKCLQAHGRAPEAQACLYEAHRLMPGAVTPRLALRSLGAPETPPPRQEERIIPSPRAHSAGRAADLSVQDRTPVHSRYRNETISVGQLFEEPR